MLRLILMRHAKSDWGEAGQADHDRPLNRRGMHDAPQMANWLREQALVPDWILASSARRTQETAELLTRQWQSQDMFVSSEDLYLASPEAIQRVINQDGCDFQDLMVLGHNPGLSYFASSLSNELIQLPTAGIIAFEVAIEQWSDFRVSSSVKLIAIMKPKSF